MKEKELSIRLKRKYEALNRADLAKHIFLFVAGLSVLLWTIYLMVNPLKYALGLILFFITIVVGELLLIGNEEQIDNRSHERQSGFSNFSRSEFVIAAIFAVSLAIIYLVPAVREEIFIEWSALELPTIARLIAAFGLNFFPGYLILAIIGKTDLGKLSKLLTSFLLSLFVLMLTGYVSARVAGVINDFFFNAIFFVYVALLVLYLFKCFLRHRSKINSQENITYFPKGLRRILPAFLVVLAIAFIGMWLWWSYSRVGFFIGPPGADMWRIHSAFQTFLDYKAFRWLHSPWWLGLYLACFTVVSGAPSVNAYITLYPLITLPVLSFYLMSSNFFKDKRIASISTLSYAMFSGPSWLYALYLRDFKPDISYDSWMQVMFKTGDKFLYQNWYPPFLVGFNGAVIAYMSLWWMVYWISQLDLGEKSNFSIMSITFMMSYLLHGIDALVFFVYLAGLLIVYFLTQNLEGKRRVRFAALSALLGLGIVALLDISLTSQYDYFNSISLYALSTRWYYFNSPSFYLLALASISIIALTYGRFIQGKLMQLRDFVCRRLAPKHMNLLRRRLAETLFFAYVVSLIVFISQLPHLTVATTGYGWVPWYVYPVIGGVPTFLGLVGIATVLRRWNEVQPKIRNVLIFCAISLVSLFIFGQITSFVNERLFFTLFWERRILNYMHPLLSMLTAYAIVTLLNYESAQKLPHLSHLARIGAVSILTALIILGSVSSTLIAGDFETRVFFSTKPTDEELEALNFLHYSLPLGYKTAYLTKRTGTDYIRAFASDKWTEDPRLWLGLYSYSAIGTLNAIRQADIKFLYLNRLRDTQELEKNLFLQQLIKVLPKEFENSEVTIYSIPSLRLPVPFSWLGLVSFEEKTGSPYDAYVLWFMTLLMSRYSYSVISNVSDTIRLNSTTNIILPFDPLPTKEEQGELLDWVSKGGHLLVSNANPYGTFSEFFGLTSKVSLVNCDSTENWMTRAQRGQIFLENTSKVEGDASLRMQNNQSSWEEWVYTPSSTWDLSSYEYLGIWVYGGGGGPTWYLYLTDANDNESFFRYDLSTYDTETRTYEPSFIGWKLHLIPLHEYWDALDLSSIVKLRIVTGFRLPVNMLIDEIFALREIGREDIVFNTEGIVGSVSIDLPSIEVEGLIPNTDTRVIANFTREGEPVTPFAIQKDLGNGKVTYINANLLYQAILSEGTGFKSPYEVLTKILEIVGVESPL